MGSAKAKDTLTENAKKVVHQVQSLADNAWQELNKRVEDVSVTAKQRSAGTAVTLIDLQRSAFDHSLKFLAKVQMQGGKFLKEHVHDAPWMPDEGKDIISEWNHTLNSGRAEFQKSVDKSYGLLRTLFERVEKEQEALVKQREAKTKKATKAASPKPKQAAAKKIAAAKKTAVRTASSKKAATKK